MTSAEIFRLMTGEAMANLPRVTNPESDRTEPPVTRRRSGA